ncbi:MAG: alpha/beta hydrolase [Marinobacter sp.]|uniref:alpha/beta hydrolase n=1 Tax=Marinobacter sp. TaxID=50741 RepID=UPI00396ED72B
MTIQSRISTRNATRVKGRVVSPANGKIALLGKGMNWLHRVSPALAGNAVEHLFFTPSRLPAPSRYEFLYEEAEGYTQLRVGRQTIPVYSWGFGPTVLMVHGWSGAGIQFGAFVGLLVKAGYRVIAFDAPGHGRAQGLRTDLFEMSEAVYRVAHSFGPLKAVVAHSIGSLALARAMVDGVQAEHVFLLAPPRDLESVVEGFGRTLGLSPELIAGHRGRMEQRFGESVWQQFSFDTLAPDLPGRALIFVDRDDQQTPVGQSETVFGKWPNAQIFRTRGLGHYRLLWYPQVVERVYGRLSGVE